MIALLLGATLAVAALAFVLQPLFVSAVPRVAGARPADGAATDGAVSALREVEFDRATGKLSEQDYAVLKARYTAAALAELRAGEPGSAVSDSDVEAVIRRYRAATISCPACGPRPEGDARYCSNCGRSLVATCRGCGRAITEPDARFCSACGAVVAA